MKYNKLTIYTDGGVRALQIRGIGPGGAGVVILNEEGKIVSKISKFLGQTTNNQAEYKALILGLQKARALGAKEVDCYSDSELMVKQLNREYKIKDKDLAWLFIKVWNLTFNFKKVRFFYIEREKNKEADRLVNLAINKEVKR